MRLTEERSRAETWLRIAMWPVVRRIETDVGFTSRAFSGDYLNSGVPVRLFMLRKGVQSPLSALPTTALDHQVHI
jgi:hypothetical protein